MKIGAQCHISTQRCMPSDHLLATPERRQAISPTVRWELMHLLNMRESTKLSEEFFQRIGSVSYFFCILVLSVIEGLKSQHHFMSKVATAILGGYTVLIGVGKASMGGSKEGMF